MKYLYLIPVVFLTGCSWLHSHSWFHKQAVSPESTQLVVNGAPAGSFLLIDGVQAGSENSSATKSQVVDVAPGMHTIEVKVRDKITYRENTYVAAGEKHLVLVLSGNRGE
jgi:Ethanolamine utilization protein EutJ (predicted chaperonin)